MKINTKQVSAALLVSLLLFSGTWAQKNYRVAKDSEIKVKGTSTVHNWEMISRNFDCSASLAEDGGQLKSISRAVLNLNVETLRSESDGLNKKAYDALKTKEIKFASTGFNDITSANGRVTGTVAGNLTIAGVTKPVTFPFEGNMNGEDKITIKANYKVNMKDYGIEPPKAMMGMIKSGKDVEIQMYLNLINQ